MLLWFCKDRSKVSFLALSYIIACLTYLEPFIPARFDFGAGWYIEACTASIDALHAPANICDKIVGQRAVRHRQPYKQIYGFHGVSVGFPNFINASHCCL